MPRWAILTGSAQVVSLQIKLSVISPATQPVAHATIYLTNSADNQKTPLKLTTDKHGQASTLVPYGPARVLTASYPGEGEYNSALTQVEAKFQASTSDFASKRLLASGEPVTFHGALRAGPIPRGSRPAAKILLQYRNGGHWITWGTTQTHGAKWRITLALVSSPRAVTTRALVMPSKKYPYLQGSGRIVHLYITHKPPVSSGG